MPVKLTRGEDGVCALFGSLLALQIGDVFSPVEFVPRYGIIRPSWLYVIMLN